jgi:hypothetical protein
VSDTHFDWACSHTDTIDVELIGNAIAYRLDWSDGWSDILPADPGGLSQKDALDTRPRQRIRIGFASCLGDTVDPKGLATLRELRLTALFVDGSELRFAPAHARLDGHRVRLPRELQPEAVTATVTPLAPPPLTSLLLHARNEHRPLWPMIGAVAGLAVATSMALRWRVRLSDHVSLG